MDSLVQLVRLGTPYYEKMRLVKLTLDKKPAVLCHKWLSPNLMLVSVHAWHDQSDRRTSDCYAAAIVECTLRQKLFILFPGLEDEIFSALSPRPLSGSSRCFPDLWDTGWNYLTLLRSYITEGSRDGRLLAARRSAISLVRCGWLCDRCGLSEIEPEDPQLSIGT
jgi:hypothetical protein